MKDRFNLRAALTLMVALSALSVLVSVAHAGTVALSWTAPTTCADGSPITDCPTAGFEVSEGASQTGTFAIKENVGPGARSVTYPNIAAGTTKCFSLKTLVGTAPNQMKSDESQRACVTVPLLPPKAPTGLSVTVQVTITTP